MIIDKHFIEEAEMIERKKEKKKQSTTNKQTEKLIKTDQNAKRAIASRELEQTPAANMQKTYMIK
jgi:hypothetical protein